MSVLSSNRLRMRISERRDPNPGREIKLRDVEMTPEKRTRELPRLEGVEGQPGILFFWEPFQTIKYRKGPKDEPGYRVGQSGDGLLMQPNKEGVIGWRTVLSGGPKENYVTHIRFWELVVEHKDFLLFVAHYLPRNCIVWRYIWSSPGRREEAMNFLRSLSDEDEDGYLPESITFPLEMVPPYPRAETRTFSQIGNSIDRIIKDNWGRRAKAMHECIVEASKKGCPLLVLRRNAALTKQGLYGWTLPQEMYEGNEELSKKGWSPIVPAWYMYDERGQSVHVLNGGLPNMCIGSTVKEEQRSALYRNNLEDSSSFWLAIEQGRAGVGTAEVMGIAAELYDYPKQVLTMGLDIISKILKRDSKMSAGDRKALQTEIARSYPFVLQPRNLKRKPLFLRLDPETGKGEIQSPVKPQKKPIEYEALLRKLTPDYVEGSYSGRRCPLCSQDLVFFDGRDSLGGSGLPRGFCHECALYMGEHPSVVTCAYPPSCVRLNEGGRGLVRWNDARVAEILHKGEVTPSKERWASLLDYQMVRSFSFELLGQIWEGKACPLPIPMLFLMTTPKGEVVAVHAIAEERGLFRLIRHNAHVMEDLSIRTSSGGLRERGGLNSLHSSIKEFGTDLFGRTLSRGGFTTPAHWGGELNRRTRVHFPSNEDWFDFLRRETNAKREINPRFQEMHGTRIYWHREFTDEMTEFLGGRVPDPDKRANLRDVLKASQDYLVASSPTETYDACRERLTGSMDEKVATDKELEKEEAIKRKKAYEDYVKEREEYEKTLRSEQGARQGQSHRPKEFWHTPDGPLLSEQLRGHLREAARGTLGLNSTQRGDDPRTNLPG